MTINFFFFLNVLVEEIDFKYHEAWDTYTFRILYVFLSISGIKINPAEGCIALRLPLTRQRILHIHAPEMPATLSIRPTKRRQREAGADRG